MLYQAYQMAMELIAPFQAASGVLAMSCTAHPLGKELGGLYDWLSLACLRHERPPFDILNVRIEHETVPVSEVVVYRTPFCSLLHFQKAIPHDQPRVLVVAPLAGHFATLLRGTVATMLPDHDVYLTDWHNARDVPASRGPFGFDDFVHLLIELLQWLGPDTHVAAICQPTVAALAAVAMMAEDGHAALPRSMTLMAGPVDTRIQPTRIDRMAMNTPLEWFEHHVIDVVPWHFSGRGRHVYPGFLQVAAFLSMHPARHVGSLMDCYRHLVQGDRTRAEAIRAFYLEYFATMDVPAEFYLDTISKVFQQHALPCGQLAVRGRRVDTRFIQNTALLTIEGEEDDICALGQTAGAHDLCASLPPRLKRHYVQSGVGHYGVFAGHQWVTQIYPVVRDFIHSCERQRMPTLPQFQTIEQPVAREALPRPLESKPMKVS